MAMNLKTTCMQIVNNNADKYAAYFGYSDNNVGGSMQGSLWVWAQPMRDNVIL